jgi:hypothetical protein
MYGAARTPMSDLSPRGLLLRALEEARTPSAQARTAEVPVWPNAPLFLELVVQPRDVMAILCVNLREVRFRIAFERSTAHATGKPCAQDMKGTPRFAFEQLPSPEMLHECVSNPIGARRRPSARRSNILRGESRRHRYFHVEADVIVAIRTSPDVECFFAALVALHTVRLQPRPSLVAKLAKIHLVPCLSRAIA